MFSNPSKISQTAYTLILLFACSVILFLSLTAIPIGSDDGRVIYFSRQFFTGGRDQAFSTLEPFLPVSFYASLLALDPLFPITIVQGISSCLLVLLVSKYIRKSYGIAAASLAPLLFLVSYTFLERATVVVPYPLFLLFVTMSVLHFIKYREAKSKKYLFTSSLFMAFAVFTFNLAVTVLTVAFGVFVFQFLKTKTDKTRVVIDLLLYYLISVALLAPWFIWRFRAAGLSFYKNPIHWLGEKYWSEFNILLFNRPKPLSSDYFHYFYTTGFQETIGFLVLAFFFFAGLLKIKHKAIIILWVLSPLYPIFIGKLPTESRYLYGVIPPLIITISAGIVHLLRQSVYRKMIYLFLVSFLLISTGNNLSRYYPVYQSSKMLKNEVQSIESNMVPGDVVYFRSFQMQGVLPYNFMISPQYMKEVDAITFISWQNEADVMRVMKTYGIDWILLYKSLEAEKRFSSWINIINANLTPQHYIQIDQSPHFQKKLVTDNFILYRYIY